jgi:hypothetical protein
MLKSEYFKIVKCAIYPQQIFGVQWHQHKKIFLSEVDIKTPKSRDNVQENFVTMLIDGTQWYSMCTRWYPAKVHRGFFGFWEIPRLSTRHFMVFSQGDTTVFVPI